MKEKAAQQITDTIKLKHHRAKVPTVTMAGRVAKAVKELTSAICNEPTDGPLDYIEAVQRLRAVLLKEQLPTRDELYRSVENMKPHNNNLSQLKNQSLPIQYRLATVH
eukprot:818009-Ditylum_brightwellii.AAC.1